MANTRFHTKFENTQSSRGKIALLYEAIQFDSVAAICSSEVWISLEGNRDVWLPFLLRTAIVNESWRCFDKLLQFLTCVDAITYELLFTLIDRGYHEQVEKLFRACEPFGVEHLSFNNLNRFCSNLLLAAFVTDIQTPLMTGVLLARGSQLLSDVKIGRNTPHNRIVPAWDYTSPLWGFRLLMEDGDERALPPSLYECIIMQFAARIFPDEDPVPGQLHNVLVCAPAGKERYDSPCQHKFVGYDAMNITLELPWYDEEIQAMRMRWLRHFMGTMYLSYWIQLSAVVTLVGGEQCTGPFADPDHANTLAYVVARSRLLPGEIMDDIMHKMVMRTLKDSMHQPPGMICGRPLREPLQQANLYWNTHVQGAGFLTEIISSDVDSDKFSYTWSMILDAMCTARESAVDMRAAKGLALGAADHGYTWMNGQVQKYMRKSSCYDPNVREAVLDETFYMHCLEEIFHVRTCICRYMIFLAATRAFAHRKAKSRRRRQRR